MTLASLLIEPHSDYLRRYSPNDGITWNVPGNHGTRSYDRSVAN